MRARRGDAQQHVAFADLGAVEQLRFFHRADGEAGQVVFAGAVHVGHFRGFAADQGAAGEFAAFGDAGDDGDGGVDVELAGGEIVQEEQRLGALHQHVVHAHADQVDADGVVAAQLLGQLELGAHAVGARDQHRLAVLAGQVEQRAEAAQAAHHFRPEGALDQRLDALDEFIAGVDINTRVAVGEGSGRGHGRSGAGKGPHSTSRQKPGSESNLGNSTLTPVLGRWTRRRLSGTIPACPARPRVHAPTLPRPFVRRPAGPGGRAVRHRAGPGTRGAAA